MYKNYVKFNDRLIITHYGEALIIKSLNNKIKI